jgi:hypothetical protein
LTTTDLKLPGPRHLLRLLAVYVGAAAATGIAFLLIAVVIAKPVLSGIILIILAGLVMYLRPGWHLVRKWRAFSTALNVDLRSAKGSGADTRHRGAK